MKINIPRSSDAQDWLTEGGKKALELFRQVSSRVPAYRDFLKNQRIDPASIKTITDFSRLPSTDKKNYIHKYPLADLCWDGDLSSVVAYQMSTGSTGAPFFWPMNKAMEDACFDNFLFVFKELFKADTRRTLVLNCFTMGAWPAGTITDHALEFLNKECGLKVQKFSPGLDFQYAANLIMEVGKDYDQLVICGYWKAVRGLIDVGKKSGINWKKFKIRMIHGGEAFPESWRDNLIKDTGMDPDSDINFYASSEAGIIATETSLTIGVRRHLAGKDSTLGGLIFNDHKRQPSIQQYNPALNWLEVESNSEGDDFLIITANNSIPLIRYKSGDTGGVLTFDSMTRLTKRSKEHSVGWPAVYVFGRDHTSVTYYGLKIYQEHFVTALENPKLRKFISRGYVATVQLEGDDTELKLTLELAPEVKASPALTREVKGLLVKNLRAINASYDKLLSSVGKSAEPHLDFKPFGDQIFKGNKQAATKKVTQGGLQRVA